MDEKWPYSSFNKNVYAYYIIKFENYDIVKIFLWNSEGWKREFSFETSGK